MYNVNKKVSIKKQKLKPLPYFIYFVFLFFLNCAFISKAFHYDSISLASWAEGKRFYVGGQQHHILLTLINYLFYSLCSLIFHIKSALIPLTVLQCFVGALGVIIFLAALNILFENKLLAIFGSLGLAFSINYWRYSTLLETHIIPTVFLIISFYFLVVSIRRQSLRHIFYAGLFSCLSLFSSAQNIVFIPAFLILIISTKSLSINRRIRYALAYINTILAFFLIPFSIVGIILFYAKSQTFSLSEAVKFNYSWFKGHLYIRSFQANNLFWVFKNIINSILISKDTFVTIVLFYATAFILSIRNIRLLFREYSNVTFCALTAAAFFLTTLLFYEPFNLQRYTPLLIFVWLIICLWVKNMFSKNSSIYAKLIAFLFITFLFINNLTFSMAPNHLEKNNFNLKEALLLKAISGKQDIIITAGGERWPSNEMAYIPYFAKRKNLISIKALTDVVSTGRPLQVVLLKLQGDIETALNNNRKVFVLEDAFVLDIGKNRERLPYFYSLVTNFLKSRYCVKEYLSRDGVTIYNLTKIGPK